MLSIRKIREKTHYIYSLLAHTVTFTIMVSLLPVGKSCKSGEFYCPSGACISSNLTCNGVSNCPDGADEPSVCRTVKVGKKSCMCAFFACWPDIRVHYSN